MTYPDQAMPAPAQTYDFDPAVNPDDNKRPLYGATFGQATKRFFKNYANFSGRASRSEYWWAMLFQTLILLVPIVFFILALLTMAQNPSTGQVEVSGVGAVFLLLGSLLWFAIIVALIVPSLSLGWRRMHDADLAGPFFLLSLVPSVGSIICIVLCVLPSKITGRRFDTAR